MKIEESGAEYYKNEFRCSPAIKEYTENQNNQIFEFFGYQIISN